MSFFDPHGVSFVNPSTSYRAQVIQQRPVNYPFQALSQQNIPQIISYLQQNGYIIYKPLEVPFRDYRFVEFISEAPFDIHLNEDNYWYDNPLRVILNHFNDTEFSEFFKYPSDMVSDFYLAVNCGPIFIQRIHPQMSRDDVYTFNIKFPINDTQSHDIQCTMGEQATNPISQQDLCRDFEFPSGIPTTGVIAYQLNDVNFKFLKWDDDWEGWTEPFVAKANMTNPPVSSPFNNRHIYNTLGIYEDIQQRQSGGFIPTVGFAFANQSNPGYDTDLYGVRLYYQITIMIAIAKN